MKCPHCGSPNQLTSFCTGCGQSTASSAPSVSTTSEGAGPTVTRADIARSEAPDAYLKLEPSEAAVFHAASRVFAAYLSNNQVTEETEAAYMKRAVSTAIQLAVLTERRIQSDDEEW